ncbi:MAG: Hydrolase, HAD-superfamily, subfamily, partial [Marmoricola sp.]|nr:Hydrolase, HAD-superfamily, subfamily [Marmoricola sp.]
ADLDVDPSRTVVVGDIGSDVEAGRAAGPHTLMVPAPATRSHEEKSAGHVAITLAAAIDDILAGHW